MIQRGQNLNGLAAVDNLNILSISGDGNTLATLAPNNDAGGLNAGQVRVYSWNPTTSLWVQRGQVLNGTASSPITIPLRLSNDGNSFVLGRSGSLMAQIYQWSVSTWIFKGSAFLGVGSPASIRDISFSLDGNSVAVSSISNMTVPIFQGVTQIFDWNGTSWIQRGLNINGDFASSSSGRAISLSADSNTIAIGAGAGPSVGSVVKIFDWDSFAAVWQQRGSNILGRDPALMSVNISFDGNRVVIGEPGVSGANGISTGSIIAYDWAICDNGSLDLLCANISNVHSIAVDYIKTKSGGPVVSENDIVVNGDVSVFGNLFANQTTYVPSNPNDWAVPVPTTMREALDRCAALLRTLNFGLGP